MDFQSDADPAQAQTCWVISAPQLDRARNVQFRHFLIHSERHKIDLVAEVSSVSNERNVLQLIHVVRSDGVEVAR